MLPVPAQQSRALVRFLRATYGVEGDLARLPGENLNIKVTAGRGSYVLKVATQGQTRAELEFEHALIAHLSDAVELPLPETVPTTTGEAIARYSTPDGEERPARLSVLLAGTPWNRLEVRPPALLSDLGRQLAGLDLALAGFEHPEARRDHAWNLAGAHRYRSTVANVAAAGRQAQLDEALRIFNAARADLDGLPRSILHGDANDENVLCEGERVVGLVDFGDALDNPVICELAIACTYALLADEPGKVAELVSGYHCVRPLSAAERSVLAPLIFGRLGISLATAAQRRREEPAHPTYFATEARGWALLERLLETGPRRLGTELCGGIASSPPPATAAELTSARRRIGPSLSVAYDPPLVITRGRGQYLFDGDQRPYLDLVNNVCHVGHCHPHVVAAGQEQMARLNTNSRYLYPGLTDYAERLCATLPAHLEVCYFVNSGSEANELALRLARAVTGRRALLVVDGAYHGNTSTLIAASPYKFLGPGGSGRSEPWVHTVPMPDRYRNRDLDFVDTVRAALEAAAEPVGAFIVEPLLGCGGQIVPPDGYLEAAFDLVRAAGGVAIADEVQVGFGRVGTHFWAFEAQGASPDIVVAGKPIGNGHPMAAVVTTREIADAFANGMEFFSTFGGNPVSCAIGMAVLDVIERQGLQRRALEVGGEFRRLLDLLADEHACIGDVRGRGLFLGVELVADPATRAPDAELASQVVERLRHDGFLLSTDGPRHNVLKIKPPMVLDEEDVAAAARALDRALRDLRR